MTLDPFVAVVPNMFADNLKVFDQPYRRNRAVARLSGLRVRIKSNVKGEIAVVREIAPHCKFAAVNGGRYIFVRVRVSTRDE